MTIGYSNLGIIDELDDSSVSKTLGVKAAGVDLREFTQTDTGMPMFLTALFPIAEWWKQPSTHQQMNG